MKKLLKIIILILGIMPVLVRAEEKEVNYKWYQQIESNIRYESEVENVCEYFDKTKYITSEWNYTTTKPEEKEYRIIEETNLELGISRLYTKILEIRHFSNYSSNIYELEFYDKSDNIINYNFRTNYLNGKQINILKDNLFDEYIPFTDTEKVKIDLDTTINIKDLKIKLYHEKSENLMFAFLVTYANDQLTTNAFDNSAENVVTECNDEYCITEITFKENLYSEPINVNTKGYKYQDKYYKCYDLQKSYIPGYHKDLTNEGYIKDENDYIEIMGKVDNINTEEIKEQPNYCITPEIFQEQIPDYYITPEIIANKTEESTPITEDITKDLENHINKSSNQIAMVTKETAKDNIPEYLVFLTVFSILSIILTIIIITKKIKNCRTK